MPPSLGCSIVPAGRDESIKKSGEARLEGSGLTDPPLGLENEQNIHLLGEQGFQLPLSQLGTKRSCCLMLRNVVSAWASFHCRGLCIAQTLLPRTAFPIQPPFPNLVESIPKAFPSWPLLFLQPISPLPRGYTPDQCFCPS